MADDNRPENGRPEIGRPQIARDPELERAQAWWKDHGRAIVAGIAIGLSAVVGFNYWQHHQQTNAENASVLFERLRSVIEVAAEAEAEAEVETETETEAETETETEIETETAAATETETETGAFIEIIAEELMADYSATPYAVHGAFALAKFSVDDGDLDQAAGALQWILDNGDDDGLRHIARLRLGSVRLANGEAAAALALLEVEYSDKFASRYLELTGDAHQQMGDAAAARDAYQQSMSALPPNAPERALLKLKLDDSDGRE